MDNDDKLKILGQTAADVPERLATLKQQLAEFEGMSVERQQHFNEVRMQLRGQVEQVMTELDLFTSESRELHERVVEVTESAKTTLDGLGENWDSEIEEMSTQLDQAGGRVLELDTFVDEATQRMTASVQQIQSAEEALQQQLTSNKEAAIARYDTLQQSMESMHEMLDEVQNQSQETVSALGESIDTQQSSLASRMGELATECGSLVEKFEDAVTDVHLDVLTSGVDGMVEAATQRVENEAKEIVRDTLTKVTELLDELTDKITDANGETAAIREAISPIIDELDDLLAPLEGLIDAVKSVAGVFSAVTSIF